MKVLFIGSTRRTALALHYFTNLVKLGHTVLPYECDFFQTKNLWERGLVGLRRQPLPTRVDQVSSDLIRLCQRNQFDAVMLLAENYLSAEVIEEMRRTSNYPPVFFYHSHDNNFSDGILKPPHFFETLRAFDLVFTTKSQNVARYQELGQENSFFLASAYEPTVHHPIEDRYSRFAGQPFDVTFIGTYDRSRVAYLEKVGWDRIHVWGDHWKRFKRFRQVKDRVSPRAIYDFEFADVTSHSKLALGLLREEAEDLHTTRTFEIPACGALQVAPRNPEVLSFFKENEEIVCFDSAEELKEKVDYYLRNEWQRIQIARRGFERCLRDKHTYQDRMKEMLKKVEMLRPSVVHPTTTKVAVNAPSMLQPHQ